MILDPSAPNIDKHTHEEIVLFWDSLEDLLVSDENIDFTTDKNAANSALVAYLKVITDAYKVFINTDRDLYRMALILVESKLFEQDREFCLSKLLSLLNIDLLELNMKFFISYILLCEAKKNLNSLSIMLEFQGFTVFYNTLYTQFAYLHKYGNEGDDSINDELQNITDVDIIIIDEMKQISTVLMDILFQVFKFCKCTISNVQLVDNFFVHYLMSSIRSDTTSDLFNNAQFKLLLALNEQYMMFRKEYKLENKVFKYLINTTLSQSFTELLLLKFNRTTDCSLQIMMCKVLYNILSFKEDDLCRNFFYLNDLNVFVDVLLRELQNISDVNEGLRNTFLRVLIPLLKNTELAKTHYRKDDLRSLLKYLSTLDNICPSDNVKDEHKTTVKLAFKCLTEVEWLGFNSNENISTSNHGSRTSSISGMGIGFSGSTPVTPSEYDADKKFFSTPDISVESLEKRKAKPPPPPPPSRKMSYHNRIEVASHIMGHR